MARNPFTGDCLLCGRELAKAAATRHLSTCPSRAVGTGSGLHLVVESADYKDFWLHLHVAETATLATLDAFLRDTWLECCGHLSAFEIAGERFESTLYETGWGPPSRTMRVPLRSVLAKGTAFRYEYDFGSTTALVGRCVGTVDRVPVKPAVRLLAQNRLPHVPCACGAAAVWLGDEATCQACTDADDAGDFESSGLLPVVNSPRMGVCGYTGP